jgi:hypothetical protein
MGRYTSTGSTDHHCQRLGYGFRISWVVDRYYAGSRLRFPTRYSRDTDAAGAQRFCKKWGIKFPEG